MKKIPTLFERDWEGDKSRVVPTVNPLCQWVIDGEGTATRKIDGMCTAVIGGKFFKRREVKKGAPLPEGFILVDQDETTAKTVGWVPVTDGPEDRFLGEAWADGWLPDGTYELVGPKSQGNAENFSKHTLVAHSLALAFEEDPPRDFDGLKTWLTGRDIEGIVWHHPDGRMVKLKLRDFGIVRSPNAA